jgi:hypothetical protein
MQSGGESKKSAPFYLKSSEDAMRSVLAVAILGISAATACGQTLYPVSAEFSSKKPARGEITVRNNSIYPEIVTIEGLSFTIGKDRDGQFFQSTRPIDPGVHVKLSATSVRLDANSSATIAYEGKCDAPTCEFVLLAKFNNGKRTKEGVNVVIAIPASIYICPQEKGCHEKIKKEVFGL